jgi:hypothetical protein
VLVMVVSVGGKAIARDYPTVPIPWLINPTFSHFTPLASWNQGTASVHCNSGMEDSYQDRSLPEDPVVAHASGAEELSDTLDSGNPTLKNYYAILNVHNTVRFEQQQPERRG